MNLNWLDELSGVGMIKATMITGGRIALIGADRFPPSISALHNNVGGGGDMGLRYAGLGHSW
jgi:hypothetical protein